MMSSRRCLLVSCLIGILGCSSSERARQQYLDKADTLFRKKQYAEAKLNFRKVLQSDPRSSEALLRLGLVELQLANLPEAYRHLNRAAQVAPEREEIKVALADVSLARFLADPRRGPRNFYETVATVSQELLAKDPSSYDGLRLAAHLRLADQRAAEAIGLFQRADAVRPGQPDVVIALVKTLADNDRFPEAERLALRFLDSHPTVRPIYDILYREYESASRLADAEQILQRKNQANREDTSAVIQLCRHYAIHERKPEVGPCVDRLFADKGRYRNAHLRASELYYQLRDTERAIYYLEEGIAHNPGQRTPFETKISEIMADSGRVDEAVARLENALAREPNDPAVRRSMANLLLRRSSAGPHQAARVASLLTGLVRERPEDAELRFELGRAHMAAGALNEAAKEFRASIARNPAALAARVALAKTSLLQKNPKDSLDQANSALELAPDNLEAKLLRTSSLLAAGEHKTADTELAGLLKRNPFNPEVLLQYALGRLALGHATAAEVIFSELYRQGPGQNHGVLSGLIESILAQNQPNRAMRILEKAEQLNPSSVELLRLLASTAVRDGRFDQAIQLYRKMIAAEPNSAPLHARLGEVYFLQGDIKSGAAAFAHAVRLDPKPVSVNTALASLQLTHGDRAGAMALYRRILDSEPGNPIALNNLSFLLTEEANGDLEEAQRFAEKAVRLAPNNLVFKDTLGWVYFKKGKNGEALQVFESLHRSSPTNATFRYHFGAVLAATGQKARARQELQAAMSQRPAGGEERKIKDLLAKL